MKIFRKIFTTVLAVTLVATLFCGSVMAAKDKYTYTVTILVGRQGSFESTNGLAVDGENASVSRSDDKIVITGLEKGDVVSFNAQSAVDMDSQSKHYVQGIRLSGRDNDTVAASAFTVDSDRDYVVAYGIKGNVTSYTIYYEDADGNQLAEKDVFYGNVGDKPVVAYKYIEGYEPQVLGYTKTLSENEADNVFTFVYDEITTENTTVVVPGENDDDDATGGDGAGTADADDANDAGQTDETPDDDTNAADDNALDNENESEIVDLDDEETPLANVDANEGGKGIPMAGMIAILIIALVALANVGFFLKKRIQKN